MKKNNKITAVFCLLLNLFSITLVAQTTSAIIPGDFPDPTVIRTPQGYYAAGTSSEWAPHFPVYHSTDLLNWKQVGYVFDKTPEWASGSFWAPEYYKIGNTYYLYYVARRKSDNISCIGVATSKYPDHGFKDHGVILAYGREAIDPFIYNDNGQLYITFKAYGLDNRPIELVAQKLSGDGLKISGESISLLKDDKKAGMEGQSFLKHGKYFYLFYSAGGCCGIGCSYHIKIARATNFAGPYEKYDNEEVLKTAPGWKCSGHGTFVETSDGKCFFVCHAYNDESNVFTGRQGMLAELKWPGGDQWPLMQAVNVPRKLNNIHDSFISKTPDINWQYDFHSALPNVKQGKGMLCLSGKLINNTSTGIAYGVRPLSADFEMSTTVVNNNNAVKGLCLYGSAKNTLVLGVSANQVCLYTIKNGVFRMIDSVKVDPKAVVQLKLNVKDKTGKAFYKQAKGEWKAINGKEAILLDFLPQWDAPPRGGLFFKGDTTENASFSRFDVINKNGGLDN